VVKLYYPIKKKGGLQGSKEAQYGDGKPIFFTSYSCCIAWTPPIPITFASPLVCFAYVLDIAISYSALATLQLDGDDAVGGSEILCLNESTFLSCVATIGELDYITFLGCPYLY